MPNLHFNNALLTVNGVDLSDQVASVTLEESRDALENSAMGDNYRSRIGGMRDTNWTITFNQDYAASEVNATLRTAMDTSTGVVACTLKAVNAATSATNPLYTQSVLVTGITPVGGSVGDLAQVSVTWPGAGALVETTS